MLPSLSRRGGPAVAIISAARPFPLILNLLQDGPPPVSAHPELVEGWPAAPFRSSGAARPFPFIRRRPPYPFILNIVEG